jgi:O-antigen/teichoic acid export membrane protein
VIQQRDESRDVLDTTWSILLLRNVIITAAIFFGADLIADFFDEPAARDVVRVISLSLLLEGLSNISVVLFQKRLDFRRQALYQGGGEIVEFAVTVGLAISLRSVWALVWGRIAGAAARVLFSYVAEPRRPRFHINRPAAGKLIGYGKWVTASSILGYVLMQGDKLIVGRFMGTASLGFYQIAFTISNLPATAISMVLAGVMFPAYASVQDNLPRLARMYLRTLRVTTLLSVPVSVLIAALADMMVPVLLGEKWNPAIPVIQVLAAFGLLRSIGTTTGSFFLATGKPAVRTGIQIAALVVFAAVIYPMARAWGITGVGAAITTYALLSSSYSVTRVARDSRADRGAVAAAIAIPLLCGAFSGAAILLLRSRLFPDPSLIGLLVLALVGSFVYIGGIALYDRFRGGVWRRDLTDAVSDMRQSRQRTTEGDAE